MLRSARAERPTARVLVCTLALPETASAIVSKEAGRHITRSVATRLLDRLKQDFTGEHRPHIVIEVNEWITSDAANHTRAYKLRGYDAVQLATALAARASTPPDTEFYFVTADGALANAARAENFDVKELPVWQPTPKGRKASVPAGGT